MNELKRYSAFVFNGTKQGGEVSIYENPEGMMCKYSDVKVEIERLKKELGNAKAEIEKLEEDKKILIAIKKFIKGEKYCVSTGIDDKTTYGYGELNSYGFWEYQIPSELVEKEHEFKIKIKKLEEEIKQIKEEKRQQSIQRYRDNLHK